MSEDSEKIRIVGAYSITEEAFENLSDETHMSVFDFVNESIVQEEGADSIDQTDQNTNPTNDCTEAEDFYRNFCETVDWFYLNRSDSIDSEGQTTNEQSKEDAFESRSRDKSTHGNVSPNDFQNESLQNFARRKRTVSMDHNYCSELKSCHCNFYEAENQFDCVCSDYDDDSEEKPKKKIDVKEIPENYVCNFKECEASYKSKHGLKHHIDIKHLNLKPFPCTECQYAFESALHLQYHINAAHLKLKPFKCDQCSYSTSAKYSLKEHSFNHFHQNLRPHKCNDCGKSFVRKNKLKIHINAVHLKLKPFKCSTCDASFARNEDLKKHIKNIHQKPENH